MSGNCCFVGEPTPPETEMELILTNTFSPKIYGIPRPTGISDGLHRNPGRRAIAGPHTALRRGGGSAQRESAGRVPRARPPVAGGRQPVDQGQQAGAAREDQREGWRQRCLPQASRSPPHPHTPYTLHSRAVGKPWGGSGPPQHGGNTLAQKHGRGWVGKKPHTGPKLLGNP